MLLQPELRGQRAVGDERRTGGARLELLRDATQESQIALVHPARGGHARATIHARPIRRLPQPHHPARAPRAPARGRPSPRRRLGFRRRRPSRGALIAPPSRRAPTRALPAHAPRHHVPPRGQHVPGGGHHGYERGPERATARGVPRARDCREEQAGGELAARFPQPAAPGGARAVGGYAGRDPGRAGVHAHSTDDTHAEHRPRFIRCVHPGGILAAPGWAQARLRRRAVPRAAVHVRRAHQGVERVRAERGPRAEGGGAPDAGAQG